MVISLKNWRCQPNEINAAPLFAESYAAWEDRRPLQIRYDSKCPFRQSDVLLDVQNSE